MPANETYKKIPYLNSSMNIYDYMENIRFYWNDKSIPVTVCSKEHDCSFLISKNSFNGFLDPDRSKSFCKCFGFAINSSYSHNVSSIRLDLKDEFENILKQGITPAIFINYPNQKFRNFLFFVIWHDEEERKAIYHFYINSIEILRRRKKSGRKCIPDYEYDDTMIRKEIEKVGCKAPYHRFQEDFPTCKKPEDLKRLVMIKNELSENKIPPCHEMTHVSYKLDKEMKPSPEFTVTVEYPKHVKDISQEQKIDPHALIGNIGGYIGLFLGILVYYVNISNNFSKTIFLF